MATVSILDIFGKAKKKKIGSLEIDAVISENITFNNTVTSSPIESGESISDHIYNEPLSLSMECVISDSDPGRSSIFNVNVQSSIPRQDAYETIRQMWLNKKVVSVVSGFEIYDNMAITSVDIPRSNDHYDSIIFTVEMTQIKIVDSNIKGKNKLGFKTGVIAIKTPTISDVLLKMKGSF